MDVNGTRFHIIRGELDWDACRVKVESGELVSLREDKIKPLHYDRKRDVLTLSSPLQLFTSTRSLSSLDPSDRRGASPDSFGNWYWIANDRQKIFWQPLGSRRPQVFWAQERSACKVSGGDFVPLVKEQPLIATLAGLAVTEQHYLVVGNVTQRGLFVFDLHAGGEPMVLLFPEDVDFEPFDLAPAPGGGVWILDRSHKCYWGLDRQFRMVTDDAHLLPVEPEKEFDFHPIGEPALIHPRREFPNGFSIAASDPISIESLPDGSVLILDRLASVPPLVSANPVSQILRYRLALQKSPPLLLLSDVEVVTEGGGSLRRQLSVLGYDFAFADKTLYVVESEGNQTLAFDLDPDAWPVKLEIETNFLPLHYFGSRALVSFENKIFYDVVGGDQRKDKLVSWVELQVIEEPQYDREGELYTPVFDGRERDCVWHRVFIDGCIPAETSVAVWTRAHNDPDLLKTVAFRREPGLYLRSTGAEIPFYDAFPNLETLPPGTGTWELLFQQAQGRYLEIKLVVTGNGRVTPHLHTLRAYYPRFSYPRHYLPTVYLEDDESASFLERMLANPEGMFTDIEGKINDVSMLFDARSAPPEALDWLAGWLGLMLDPLWATIQKQRDVNGSDQGKRPTDRRRLFIRFARKLYDRRGTPSGILFALQLLLDPGLEAMLKRFKNIAVGHGASGSLRDQLRQLSLASPNSSWSDWQFEDLLYEYVLAPLRPSKVRIVERYRTRGGKAKAAGDPTQEDASAPSALDPYAFAHSFSVLIPEGLTSEEALMVERIARLEKPAHAAFDVRRYWDFFRVGETRLGIDTVLGEKTRFQKMVVGRSYLAEGYLHPSHPMDVADRVISDRDRVGHMPPL